MPNYDFDGDGDFDTFDQQQQQLFDHPEGALGDLPGAIEDLESQNAWHELFEDFGELFDDNPNNDSFFDGGNGSGDEPSDGPVPESYSAYPGGWPGSGGGVPVVLTYNNIDYSFMGGNFTIIGSGGPGGGGGGFEPQVGVDDGIFGV